MRTIDQVIASLPVAPCERLPAPEYRRKDVDLKSSKDVLEKDKQRGSDAPDLRSVLGLDWGKSSG